MNKCPSCDRVIKSHNCVVCGIQVKVPTSETFPPITWQEIRDHIVERLMIEPQWMIEEEDEFTWWPYQIPQSVFVSSRVELDLDDISETLVRVTIQSILGTAVDRPKALEAVADLMVDYPFGSIVVLEDDRVVALSSVALYGRNRTLLSLVHEEALVQATFAQDISAKLVNEGVVIVDHVPHPTSGLRAEPDELLRTIYGNPKFTSLHEVEDETIRNLARGYWKRSQLQPGRELGFENDDVTFITYEDGFDCGVGWHDDDFTTYKFGKSITVMNTLRIVSAPIGDEVMNSLNLALAFETQRGVGHIGAVTQQTHDEATFIRHIAVLPHYFLKTKNEMDGRVLTVFNGILQASASARFIHGLLNYEAEDSEENPDS